MEETETHLNDSLSIIRSLGIYDDLELHLASLHDSLES